MSLSDQRFSELQRLIAATGWGFDPVTQAFRWHGAVNLACAPMDAELFYRSALSHNVTREELADFMARKTDESRPGPP